jgi:hypothetical protein
LEQRLNAFASQANIPSTALNDGVNLRDDLETFRNLLLIRMNMIEQRLNVVSS